MGAGVCSKPAPFSTCVCTDFTLLILCLFLLFFIVCSTIGSRMHQEKRPQNVIQRVLQLPVYRCCNRAATELQLLLGCRLLSVSTNCRCADAAISSRNPTTSYHKLMHFRLPPYCRGLLYIVPRHLSACLTLGLLLSRTLLSPQLAAGACCTDTARRSQTPPTILSPQVYRNRRLLLRKTRTDICSTSNATTLPEREELQHRQHLMSSNLIFSLSRQIFTSSLPSAETCTDTLRQITPSPIEP